MTLTEDQKLEIELIERPRVLELDQIIGKPFLCLDHGFIRLIDYMGDDFAIVQAARVSYGRGTKTVSDDKGLIEYLVRHRHSTPLEMCEIKLHCKMPIFVARQWIRHRTANVNEYSARYSILSDEFYIPDQEHTAPQNKENRQGRSLDYLDDNEYLAVSENLKIHSKNNNILYHYLLNDEDKHSEHPGIARELARIGMPLNSYTEWYWKTDLHNLLHFLSLRKDKHAQYEIRVYADIIGDIVKQWCPLAYDAWLNCVFEAKHFTRKQWEILKRFSNILSISPKGYNYCKEEFDIGKREFDELMEVLKGT